MMEGIRRMVRSPGGGVDHWDADRELEPEVEADFEFPVENTIMVSPVSTDYSFSPKLSGEVEFQRSILQTAMEQKGRFHIYKISIGWLRMILAGLEGKIIEPDEAWKEVEAPDPPQEAESSYEELFPAWNDSSDSAPF